MEINEWIAIGSVELVILKGVALYHIAEDIDELPIDAVADQAFIDPAWTDRTECLPPEWIGLAFCVHIVKFPNGRWAQDLEKTAPVGEDHFRLNFRQQALGSVHPPDGVSEYVIQIGDEKAGAVLSHAFDHLVSIRTGAAFHVEMCSRGLLPPAIQELQKQMVVEHGVSAEFHFRRPVSPTGNGGLEITIPLHVKCAVQVLEVDLLYATLAPANFLSFVVLLQELFEGVKVGFVEIPVLECARQFEGFSCML